MQRRLFPIRPSAALAVTAVAVVLLASLQPVAGAQGDASAGKAAGIRVPVAAVGQSTQALGLEFDGVVEPVRQATVSAQAQGRVASLQVKAGDRVRAGQLLAVIDDRETQTGLSRSQAQVSEAQAQLRNAQAQAQRLADLRAQGFVSQAALDNAQTQLRAAEAAREQAGAAQRQSQLAQGHTRVTAPFDGFVRETLVESGDLAVPGRPLLTLYAPQPLRAVVDVGASRLETARQAAQVQVWTGSDWVSPVARQWMPTADPVTQTVQWRLELPAAAAARLLPGQQVRVRTLPASGAAAAAPNSPNAPVAPVAQAANTPRVDGARLTVPRQAVLRRGELTAVYVASAQGFTLKAVRLGADRGEAGVEVLAGLSGGEQVALDPVRAGLAGALPDSAAR